jgi:hypothetical protein
MQRHSWTVLGVSDLLIYTNVTEVKELLLSLYIPLYARVYNACSSGQSF